MFKAIIKIILILFWLSVACLLALLVKKIVGKTGNKKHFTKICNLGFAGLCFICGLRVKVSGKIANSRPLLLVSNHLSYLDVLVLGAKTPAHFTPKSEVASWPVIGAICRLLNAVFIERKIGKVRDAGTKIKDTLAAGEIISLFAEGTTGNGRHLLPFKSSLFSIAEEKIGDKEVWIQPAIICYKRIGGLPIASAQWPQIAWYGDMELAPHLWQLLQLGKIEVELVLLPAVTSAQIGDRKQLANYCKKSAEGVLQGYSH